MGKRSVKIKPKGAEDPLPAIAGDTTLTRSDRDKAVSVWDRLMPQYAGLLDAMVVKAEKTGL